MDFFLMIFGLLVLIFSVVVHEVSHGYVADRLGDPTARLSGRLTLNPLKHADPVGSVILPILLIASGSGILVGWAKPVPYNPYNLKDPEKGGAIIAASGPISNFAIAIIFAIILKVIYLVGFSGTYFFTMAGLITQVIHLNIVLAVFNLVPLPPLDGSKILFLFLKPGDPVRKFLQNYGIFILIFFVFWGFSIIIPIINFLFNLIT